MNCKNCGNPIGEGAKFCTACGAPIVEDPKSEEQIGRESDGEAKKGKGLFIAVAVICVMMAGVSIAEAVQIRKLNDSLSDISQQLADTVEEKDARISELETDVEKNKVALISQEKQINEQNEAISAKNYLIQEMDSEIERLEDENEYYYDQWWDDQKEIYFYEKYAGVVDKDGGKRYHTYTCPDLIGEEFYIYNTNEAERLGYYACPKCH